jgi:hypothetical protein
MRAEFGNAPIKFGTTSFSGKPSNPLAPSSRDRPLPSALSRQCQFFVDMRLMYPLSSFRKFISSEHGFNHQRLMPASG